MLLLLLVHGGVGEGNEAQSLHVEDGAGPAVHRLGRALTREAKQRARRTKGRSRAVKMSTASEVGHKGVDLQGSHEKSNDREKGKKERKTE